MRKSLSLMSALFICSGSMSYGQETENTDERVTGAESTNITPSDKSAQVIVESATGAKISIGGFVRYDLIYDTIRTGSDAYFVTSDIPVKYNGDYFINNRQVRHSTNFFSSNAFISQVRLIATPPADWADDTIAFIEGDFSGNGGGQFNLRHAYGENKRFLFGQTWTNMMDIRDFPSILEWQGPGVLPAFRVAQADIKFYQTANTHTTVGIEDSILATLLTIYQTQSSDLLSYDSVTRTLPTFVVNQRTEGDWGHFHFGAAYSSASLSGFSTLITGDEQVIDEDYTIRAWAVNASGTINLFDGHLFQYYVGYDQGLTGFAADLYGSPDYVLSVNADGSPSLVPSLGWLLAYKIPWNDRFFTQLSGSALSLDWNGFDSPSDIAAGNQSLETDLDRQFKQTYYATINLVWQPKHGFSNGIEYVYGQRVNRDGEAGVAQRIHLVSRLNI